MKRVEPGTRKEMWNGAARTGWRMALAALAAGLLFASVSRADDVILPPLRAVDKVDLARYAGQWHEIARYPNRFQRKCASDVTAEYRALPNRQLAVVNRCQRADGTLDEATGRARVVDPFSSARLEVSFAPAWLSWLPWVWGDYWIIDLADDYSVAVVSEPEREYLWVLARSPQISDADYARVQARLSRQGFDLARLVRTSHVANRGAGAAPSQSATKPINETEK